MSDGGGWSKWDGAKPTDPDEYLRFVEQEEAREVGTRQAERITEAGVRAMSAHGGGGCMASVTDSSHLCSVDCVPIFCPFSGDGFCPAGLDFCPSMHQRMCVDDEDPR